MSLPEAPADAILTLAGLRAERDGRVLFDGLSFSAVAGEVLRIEGANGAGKTTLLRILCGLDLDFEGEVRWPAATRRSVPWRQDLLFLGHLPGVKASLSARDNLAWLAALRERPLTGDVDAALAQVGLAGLEDVPVAALSAGQRRRVGLARLFLEDARVWVLDEPFTAIDVHGVQLLEQRLAAHASSGGLVVLTTHQPLSIAARGIRLGARA
jgi:heme exporter protein A